MEAEPEVSCELRGMIVAERVRHVLDLTRRLQQSLPSLQTLFAEPLPGCAVEVMAKESL